MNIAINNPAAIALRPLVEVRDLTVKFTTRARTVHAVNSVSFDVMPGEVLCIIGESGSGKSVTMRSLMGLHSPRITQISGKVRVGDHDITALTEKQLSDIRGSLVSMVFQEPMTALDPTYTIGQQISETIVRHQKCSYHTAMAQALELLQFVKVPSAERRLKAYPHELSGGLRQRAMIAVALSCRPKLLLADEPTTALDATVQIQVLLLLRKLQQELGMGMIFVTHDLGVAAQIADNVAVMYAGQIVEYGTVRDIMLNPSHPYTVGMLSATVHGQDRGRDLETIPGSPPDMSRRSAGCSFSPRCSSATARCHAEDPVAIEVLAGQLSRCLHPMIR